MKSKQKQTPTEIIDNQRQAVVEKIIEDMKRDGLRWAEPYLPSLTPHNPVSGTVHQGGNRVHLGFIGFMRGYTDNRWATFNQIKDAGWHVKKGAKSALIEKWKQFAFYKESQTFRTFWNPIALKSHNILDMNRLKISSCPINVLMAP